MTESGGDAGELEQCGVLSLGRQEGTIRRSYDFGVGHGRLLR